MEGRWGKEGGRKEDRMSRNRREKEEKKIREMGQMKVKKREMQEGGG